jgi:hypothetical protein
VPFVFVDVLGTYSSNLVPPFGSTRSRAATALLMVAVAALLAVAMAPAAGAAVIASSWSGFEGGPALASDGRVIVGERRGNGALRILAIDPKTWAVRELIALPALADPTTYPVLKLSGTGGIVTASLDTFRQVGKTDAEQPQPTLLATRTMTILPVPAPLGSCVAPVMAPGLAAAGGQDFVASVDEDCGKGPEAVSLRTPSGTITIPAQTGPADRYFPPQISGLRASGPLVAWVEAHLKAIDMPVTPTLVVARGATGQVLLRLDGLNLSGLGSDGMVVLTDFPSCKMGVLSPASPALRTFGLSAGLCSSGDAVAVADGRIVYQTSSGYAVTDSQGVGHALAEARVRGIAGSPVAFDGRTAFVVNADCDADRLLAIDAGVPAAAPPPSRAGPASCPQRRSGAGRLRVQRGGRVTIALRCPEGCRGTLRLVLAAVASGWSAARSTAGARAPSSRARGSRATRGRSPAAGAGFAPSHCCTQSATITPAWARAEARAWAATGSPRAPAVGAPADRPSRHPGAGPGRSRAIDFTHGDRLRRARPGTGHRAGLAYR